MADNSAGPTPTSTVAVALKWVQLQPQIDPLTGASSPDDRFAGMSKADEAALELAIGFAASTGATVLAVTVGPAPADAMLRHALACGAQRALRIDPQTDPLDSAVQPTSDAVATALAGVCAGASMVWCGDWSLDRGSGSVPALLAHRLGIDHALGLVAVDRAGNDGGRLRAERRLDGGRREVLMIDGPAVLSVEGAAASLRRAPITGVLAAQQAVIEVRTQRLPVAVDGVALDRVMAHRPEPAHTADNPTPDPRARVAHVLGIGVQRTPPMRLTLDPDAAADAILERLAAWGVLGSAPPVDPAQHH